MRFVFLLALVVHGLLFGYIIRTGYVNLEMTDGGQYKQIAENLLGGHGFSLRPTEPFVPDSIRSPIYPYVLVASKAVTGSYFPTVILGFLLGLTIPLAGMKIGRLLGLSSKWEMVVGIFLALEPNLFYHSLIYGSEAYFFPLAAWAVYLVADSLVRRSVPRAIVGGSLMGLATLARPIVQFIPILVLLYAAYEGTRRNASRRLLIRTTAAFLIAFAVVVAPWLIRSYRTFGVIDYANVGWFNMYTRVAATAESIATGREYNTMRLEYLERLHTKGYVDHTPVEEWDVHGYAFMPIFQRETWEAVKKYPRETVIVHVSAFFTVVSQDLTAQLGHRLGFFEFRYPLFSPVVVLAQQGPLALLTRIVAEFSWPLLWVILARPLWLLLFLLSLAAPIVAWKKRPELVGIVSLLVLYELGIIALSLNAAAQASARYRGQFVFVEVPLAALVLAALVAYWRKRRTAPGFARCPACDISSFVRRHGRLGGRFDACRCELCNAIFLHPMPSPDDLRAFYSKQYFFGGAGGGYVDYERDKQAARHSLEDFLKIIERGMPAKGALLDVGTATGVFLEIARDRGWSVTGHEVSEDAAGLARAKNIPMTVGVLPGTDLAPSSFHAVSMLDVIEHLPDPSSMIRRVHEVLAPGGLLFINTPDTGSVFARVLGRRWHAYCPPEHVIWFDRKTLRVLLERHGFKVEWEGRVSKRFRLSYILQTAARWLNLKFLSRLAAVVERRGWNPDIPLDLRDNVAVLARKV